jgi:ERCC4-related helicase
LSKLVNLWFYLTGKNDLKIDDKVTTSLDKKDLPYEKSFLDLINELTKEIKENLEKRLRTLLKHVELENENKNKSEKVPSVIDYLKNLDKMIKDKKERDINKFLNFNFHEWYLKLGDLLEELKSFLE